MQKQEKWRLLKRGVGGSVTAIAGMFSEMAISNIESGALQNTLAIIVALIAIAGLVVAYTSFYEIMAVE